MSAKIKLLSVIIYMELCYCMIKVRDIDENHTMIRIHDAEAKFGLKFENGAKGFLIESNPILACNDTIDSPPVFPNNDSNIIFVALIKRGICTFEHKVKAAQNSGYGGVVIYNNRSNYYFSMPASDDSQDQSVFIPSRMVGLKSGNHLKKFVYNPQSKLFVLIFNVDYDFNPQYYIIAFLGFISLGFLIISLGFAFKICRDCIKRRANRLKKCHLKKIPVKKFVKGTDSFETCAICIEDFIDGVKIRILPCNHAYHLKCIDPWLLKQKRNCPICKCRIRIPGREDESDDSGSVFGSSETHTIIVNEHTPLINADDTEARQSYFSTSENDVTFAPEPQRSTLPNFYENHCINSNGESTVISSCMSINGIDEVHALPQSDVIHHTEAQQKQTSESLSETV